jgi:alanine racemase
LAALAPLCAVVKADGYGHGAIEAARAAQRGGAAWLAVATAGEAADLRAAGLSGPILVMGALSPEELDVALRAGADVVAWREEFVRAVATRAAALGGGTLGVGAASAGAASAGGSALGVGGTSGGAASAGGGALGVGGASGGAVSGGGTLGAGGTTGTGALDGGAPPSTDSPLGEIGVHVKLDTGMGRLGTRDPQEATAVANAVAATPNLRLAGAMTHFATADDDPEFMRAQLARFLPWADGFNTTRHAANSAAALAEPQARLDMIRCGIAIYGMDPFHHDPADHGLEPALELVSYVAEVKRAREGESAGYGRRFIAEADTWVGTIPIGYGDGFRRGLTNHFDVLVGGRRVKGIGTVSMDNITVDLGDTPVERGTEAVLIGTRGDERILAEDLAKALGTSNYEITCGISQRVPRRST